MPVSCCNCAGFRLLFGLALLVVTWLALTPQPVALPDAPLADKWAHLLTFALLALLLDLGWPENGLDWRKWAALMAYGLAIEWLQTQIPNRVFSFADMLANAAGVALYAAVLVPILRRVGWR